MNRGKFVRCVDGSDAGGFAAAAGTSVPLLSPVGLLDLAGTPYMGQILSRGWGEGKEIPLLKLHPK